MTLAMTLQCYEELLVVKRLIEKGLQGQRADRQDVVGLGGYIPMVVLMNHEFVILGSPLSLRKKKGDDGLVDSHSRHEFELIPVPMTSGRP